MLITAICFQPTLLGYCPLTSTVQRVRQLSRERLSEKAAAAAAAAVAAVSFVDSAELVEEGWRSLLAAQQQLAVLYWDHVSN